MPFVDLLNQPSTPSIVCSIVLALSVTYYIIMGWLGGNHGFNPKGKYVFITGGSEGLGLNLAIELAKQGANICIVARRVPVLEKAVQKIKEAAVSSNQKIEYVSSDLSSNSGCQAAVQQAKEKNRLHTRLCIHVCWWIHPKTIPRSQTRGFRMVYEIELLIRCMDCEGTSSMYERGA